MTFGWLLLVGAWPAEGAVSFVKEIAPVLQAKCVTCHNADKAKGRYRLDTFAQLQKAGESGMQPLVAGDAKRSHLYALLVVTDPDDRMPQKDDPLPTPHVELIAKWIEEGAKFDGADPNAALGTIVAAVTQHPKPPNQYLRPEPILALAFHPDGSRLAASGYHETTVWSPTNGALLQRIPNQPRQIHAISFSPDGNRIAVAGGSPGRSGEIRLVNATNTSESKVLATASDTFLSVAFSPDGRWLLAGGADNQIRQFDMSTEQEVRRLEQHADWVTGIAVAPDGVHFASASRDKTTRLFDLKTGELEETYDGHGAPVFAVAFSANGKRVLSGGRDRELHAWSTKDAHRVFVTRGFKDDVLRLIADGDALFVVSADRQISQYRTEEKKAEFVRSYSGSSDTIYSIAHHRQAKLITAGCHDGTIRVWNAATGDRVGEFVAKP